MMQTPDGNRRLELTKFEGDNRHAPANTPVSATSHSVEDIDAVVARRRAVALSLLARLSDTRTNTGSATSAARRVSSSSWREEVG
jgi:hypothetical protein